MAGVVRDVRDVRDSEAGCVLNKDRDKLGGGGGVKCRV